MLAYSHPLRPLPVADEAVPDAPENVPSAKDELPPWHAQHNRPESLPSENPPQPSRWDTEGSHQPSHFAIDSHAQPSQILPNLAKPSHLTEEPGQPSQFQGNLAEPPPFSAESAEAPHMAVEPSHWDPEAQHGSEGAEPVGAWQGDGGSQQWDPEALQDEATWEKEQVPSWQATAPPPAVWAEGNAHLYAEERGRAIWQNGMKMDGTTEEGNGSIGDKDRSKAEPSKHYALQAEAVDACSSGSRDIPSPRAFEKEETRRTALPPLMPSSTRRASADRAPPSLSEGTRPDDLHSSSGWESTRISQSNIHRASQRASSRKLYRNFASPSIGAHDYRKSRQPSRIAQHILMHSLFNHLHFSHT